MPASKSRPTADRHTAPPPRSLDDELRAQADALFRTAMECGRQRKRYARLVGGDIDGAEQELSFDLACRCDALLAKLVHAYEQAAERVQAHLDGDWWHKANVLWHASREYLRRHECAERETHRRAEHSPERLGELRTSQDLEASALLSLCFAAEAYRKTRPEAELKGENY
jgi:hypothetical protein